MEEEKIVGNILRTVGYFDLFDYPLTLLEIQRWLPVPADVLVVQAGLDVALGQSRLAVDNGWYFLPGREQLIAIRKNRYLLAKKKFDRAIFLAKILARLPYIRMIAVCGSLAYANSRLDSDIDIFVVAAAGRVWSARFFVNSFLSIFRLRPHGDKKRDKVCASFFVAEDNLDLSFIRHYREEIHFAYWLSQFVFVLGSPEKFFAANRWLENILPNFYPFAPEIKRRVAGRGQPGEFLFAWLPEKLFKRIQLAILPRRYLALAGSGQDVILSDQVIKIHTNAKGRAIQDLLTKKNNFNANGLQPQNN